MSTTTRPERARLAEAPDHDRPARELALTPPPRRVRLPELAVGLLVIVVFALAGVLWHLRSVNKVPALAVASAIERGDVVQAEDLRVVYVASDQRLARLDASQLERVVGRTALVALDPGALVTESFVADGALVGAGEGVVGLPLEPGQYPAFDLAPGDLVNVVRIGSGGSTGADSEAGGVGGGSSSSVVVRAVRVTDVQDLAGGERKLVSLLAAEDDADAIAAVDSGSVRLVLVAPP